MRKKKKRCFICLFVISLVLGLFLSKEEASAKQFAITDEVVGTQGSVFQWYQFLGTGWTDGHFKVITKTRYNWPYTPRTLYWDITAGSFKSKQLNQPPLVFGEPDKNGFYTIEIDFGHISGIDETKPMAFMLYNENHVPIGSTSKIYELCRAVGYLFMSCDEFNDIKGHWIKVTNTGSFDENFIEFAFPANATSTKDFNSWLLNFRIADRYHYGGIEISYSKNLENCTNFNDGSGCYRDYEPVPSFGTDRSILKLNNLESGTYKAKADLVNNYKVIASSTITFNITGQGTISTLWEFPTSTWTTSSLPIQITCDATDPFFRYSLCRLFLALFIPKPDALQKFTTLGSVIENKPPLGYFYKIKDVLSGVSATSTPIFNIGNYKPLNDSIFNPIRTGLNWILWLFFGVVIFNRIRHLVL